MSQLHFHLKTWSAWAPGITTLEDWQLWAEGKREFDLSDNPDVSFIPAMQRRRLSPLSKMALNVAHQIKPAEDVVTVFGSQHGELNRTRELLETLVNSEPLSPTSFSMSVHNTASGLHSILNKHKNASTSIAASLTTLEHCFIEAYGWLAQGEETVQIVLADAPVAESYKDYVAYTETPIAASFLLSNKPEQTTLRLSYEPLEDAEDVSDNENITLLPRVASDTSIVESPLLSFLRFLNTQESRPAQYAHQFNSMNWRWSYD